MIKVLYLTYENLFRNPVLQSMVINPLSEISKKYNVNYIITSSVKSFEKDEIYYKNKKSTKKLPGIEVIEFEKTINDKQSYLNFALDIYPVIKKCYNISKQVDLIHCRSYGGAIIGFIIHLLTGKPYIYDMRGTFPEETVEIGKISKNSIKFKMMKIVERILIKKSAHVVTVSNKFTEYIVGTFNKKNTTNVNNPTVFKNYFKQYRKNKEKINFIYSGHVKPWHLPDLTVKYFSKIQKKFPDEVYFYFCTNERDVVKNLFDQHNVPSNSYEINTVPYHEMPNYYSKADIAFCFIAESFPRKICFPVKFSEYVASNLFVLANKNIGDVPDIIRKYNCGITFQDLNNVDNNILEIANVVNLMKSNKFKLYERNDMSFLDWQFEAIDKYYNIYKDILKLND